MKLSARLKAIYDLIEEPYLYDVGCDHAKLSIYFVLNKGKRATAIDNNRNALNGAVDNIKKYQVEDKVTAVLSDGLTGINNFKDSVVVLSGLGTNTILKIINNKDIEHIIIQSNKDLFSLRKEITSNGYYINDEQVVKEGKIYNVVISFKKGIKKYNYSDYLLGPIIRKRKNKQDLSYLNYLYLFYKSILNKVPIRKIKRYLEIRYIIYLIKNSL